MTNQKSHIDQFIGAIRQLPQYGDLSKGQLLTEQFIMEKHGDLKMFYSPHNEYINREAKVVIVGITPGWNQMKTAFQEAVRSVHEGHSLEKLLEETKKAASFSGTMRTNLVSMLDECGIAKIFQSPSSETLFYEKRHFLHTTSVIKYPVFYQDKNYTGYRPKIDHSTLLSYYAYKIFPNEIGQLTSSPLIIPLGRSVEQVLQKLIVDKKLPERPFLFGFPHPSGANGHRKKQFEEQVLSFKGIVEKWAEKGL